MLFVDCCLSVVGCWSLVVVCCLLCFVKSLFVGGCSVLDVVIVCGLLSIVYYVLCVVLFVVLIVAVCCALCVVGCWLLVVSC